MTFTLISGENLRNLEAYKLTPSQRINIITGQNGAGKTNILEAIYLNGLGKSFRTNRAKNIIHNDKASCTVFAEYLPQEINPEKTTELSTQRKRKIGVERQRAGQQKLRVDGQDLNSMAELAKIIPMLAVQPSELELIDGGASIRRKYLDWLLFHVEHNFLDLWRDSQRLLKQRNSLLRQQAKNGTSFSSRSQSPEQIAWDREFVRASEALNEARERYIVVIRDLTKTFLDSFFSEEKDALAFDIEYKKGWDEKESLIEVLKKEYHQDLRKGFTKSGPHRADLIIRVNGQPAKEYLSRGQKKLLSMALRMAQLVYLTEQKGLKPVILVDDLASELDAENVAKFCKVLEKLDTQVFLTSLENNKSLLEKNFETKPKVFHVKRGVIS